MKKIKVYIGLVIALYVLVNVLLYFFQESIIFIDTKLSKKYVFQYDEPHEELNLKTEDGAIINALHFKHESPKGAILYYHGNAGNLSRWGQVVIPFYQLGYDVYVMDYRGYGKSRGNRIEEKMYQDADLLYEKAKETFLPDQLIAYGRSLGSTFATSVASKYEVKQLILETPFYSLRSIVKSSYWFLPVDLVLKFLFATNQIIDKVNCPITILQGTEDRVVPYENAKKLLEVNPNINWVSIESGRHNDLAKYDQFWYEIKRLLQ